MQLYSALLLPIQFYLSGAVLFLLFSSYAQCRRLQRAGLLTQGDWAAMASLFALAAFLRLTLVPQVLVHTNFHALYFVENALGPRTTETIDLLGRAPYGLTNYSLFQLCWAYLPRTLPVYLNINAILSAATVPLVFLLIRLLDGSRWWALGGAIILALLPAHMKMGPTENEITLSSFFALLTLVHWTAYLRAPDKMLLAGTVAALLLTVHSRVLTLAFPAALVVLYFALPHGRRVGPPKKLTALGGGIWAALAWPQYVYILSLLINGEANDQQARFAGKLMRAFSPESSLLFNLQISPAIVPLAFVIGGALMVWRWRWRGGLVVFATLLLSVLYHVHSAHLLDQLRYQYFLWPFVSILAGFAVGESCYLLSGKVARAAALTSWGVALAIWLIPTMPFIKMVPPSSTEATFVMENARHLPSPAVLLENEPLEVTDGRLIAPLVIPAFVIHDTGLNISIATLEQADLECDNGDKPLVLYVGLQNHVNYEGEDVSANLLPRITPEVTKLGCRLEPIVTTPIDTAGPTPGPELGFSNEEVEIGFYQLKP